MNRRKFLAAVGSAAVTGLAGCTSSSDCGKYSNLSRPYGTVTVSMETPFLRTDDISFGNGSMSDSQRKQVQRDLRLCRPITKEQVGFDDSYGPYTGYVIRESKSMQNIKNAFKSAGVDWTNEWWAFQTPDSWPDVGEKLQQRRELANGFSAKKSLDEFTFEYVPREDQGERAALVFTEAPQKDSVQKTFTAVGRSGGFAATVINESGDQDTTFINPSQSQEYISNVDVTEVPNGYQVRLSLTDRFNELVSSTPGTPRGVSIRTPGDAVPALQLSDSQNTDFVATDTLQYWSEAYASATALAVPLNSPVFANVSDDYYQCAVETTASE